MKKKISIPTLDNITSQLNNIRTDIENNFIDSELRVYVGSEEGDFSSINAALSYLSKKTPTYNSGGIVCELHIRDGFVLTEQIYVAKLDLQYITIISDAIDSIVWVDASNFIDITSDQMHDTRDNIPFIYGENAAKLPTIGCIFRLKQETVPQNIRGEDGILCNRVVGLCANRGSEAIILPNSGFIGFYDNVISNNESSITIREGIAQYAKRNGIMARHNGEISARSVSLVGSVIGAYADRCADIDIRSADLHNCMVGIIAENISRVNANGTTFIDMGGLIDQVSVYDVNANTEGELYEDIEPLGAVNSFSGSVVNLNKAEINLPHEDWYENIVPPLQNKKGGVIIATSIKTQWSVLEDILAEENVNKITNKGIIYT